MTETAFYFGPDAGAADQLQAQLGRPVTAGLPESLETCPMVFLSVSPTPDQQAQLAGGNAFAACRDLKTRGLRRLFLVVDEGDKYSAEIGRFCLADGCVTTSGGNITDVSVVSSVLEAPKARVELDALLERLQKEISSDEGKKQSAIQRMLHEEHHDWVLEHLMDRPTGLYSGAFASFKLEEEFKRAMRFHQPLSLLLLDVGLESLPDMPSQRDTCLAEAASIFLIASRDIDMLARFTETTFLFLLPGTGAEGAELVARRMLDELGQRTYGPDGIRLETRAGLATVPSAGIADRGAFLARAEACLRLAQEGRAEDGLCVSCE